MTVNDNVPGQGNLLFGIAIIYGIQPIRCKLFPGPLFLGFAGQNQQIRVRFPRQPLEYTAKCGS